MPQLRIFLFALMDGLKSITYIGLIILLWFYFFAVLGTEARSRARPRLLT